MAELQLHGGRAVIAAVLAALGAHRGLAAGRGRRVHPPRLRERQARSHRGRRPRRPDRGRDRGAAPAGVPPAARACSATAPRPGGAQLIEALALVEARIDFSDEADVPEDLLAPALASARALARRDRRGAGRRRARRAAARGLGGRDRRAAERRQVDAAQSASRGARRRSCRPMPARRAT